MGVLAMVGVLADVRSTIAGFVDVFLFVYILLILIYVLLSWFHLPYNLWLSRIQRFLYDVCEPYIALFRRVLPPLGPIDLSPAVAIIVLILFQQLIVPLIEG
jgi:YggT family protein